MFGFGSKKKKIINQFINMIQSVMGTYMIMRSLSTHRFEETKLEPLGVKIFEACYILGVIDCIGAAIDLEGKIIDQKLIIEACEDCSIGMKIFDEKDASGMFQFAMLFIKEGNAAHKLQYYGGKDAQTCINAMLDGKDSSEAAKAMGLNYLDDKELISDFKKLFDANIKGK
tara:strand:+ start:1930 stop:2442 length:513 start_codon:yes stop_codon:yes gene_type:complete